MKYKCWNPNCPYFAGKGYEIESTKPYDRCPYCGQTTLKRVDVGPPEGAKPIAGVAGGALLGWVLGGPPGAIVGGLVGLLIGAFATEQHKKP